MVEKRYSRNIGAITEKEQQWLNESRVFIAGAGGLGGYLFSYLLRIGVGHITVIDGDSFDESNLNRQLLSSDDVIGSSKAETAFAYARLVNPSVKVNAIHTFLTEDNCEELLKGHDLVLDALDNIESRHILARGCDTLGIPYVYGAIRGWNAQTGFFPAGTVAKRMKLLYPAGSSLKDKSSLSFTPALCAAYQSAEAIKYLIHRVPTLQDSLLYLDLLENETQEIPFSE